MRFLFIGFCYFLVNNAFSQGKIDSKFVGLDNFKSDSIRFLVYSDVIDAVLGEEKPHSLVIVYDRQSDYFSVSERNLYNVSKFNTTTDSLIIIEFENRIKQRYSSIPELIIKDVDGVTKSNTEILGYQATYGSVRFFIELLEPIETWESLKVALSLRNPKIIPISDVTMNKLTCFNNPNLTIPVKVIVKDGDKLLLKYFFVKYKLELDSNKFLFSRISSEVQYIFKSTCIN